MDVLKVSAHSNSIATAGALANTIRQQGSAMIQGIGPKAVNQAVKAIAISRSYLASSGVDLIAIPEFIDVEVEGQKRTAIRFNVRPRHRLANFVGRSFSTATPSAADMGNDDTSQHETIPDEDLDENQPREELQEQSGEMVAEPPREGRFIRDFPDNPLEKDEFGL